MYCKGLLILALLKSAYAIFISQDDVSCSSGGSVNIRKAALGNFSNRIYAFDGEGSTGHCHRQIREDVVQFERSRSEDLPMRMIIDDFSADVFHILDVRCTFLESNARIRRAGLYRKNSSNERDEDGNLIVGPEVNNTGLDVNGNLVRSRDFKVNVGMTVEVPYSDNAEVDIECFNSRQLGVSNPDPRKYRYFMAYDEKGNLCHLSVRPDRNWLLVKNCDTNDIIKVAFNDRQFVQGVIGGKSQLKIYKIHCPTILGGGLFDKFSDLNTDLDDVDAYYYVYDYPNSGPEACGMLKQVLLLLVTLGAVLFLERLTYVY